MERNIKIGILTFHKSINTGAFIQCYSLITRLMKDFPDEKIEVIDYCTKKTKERYSYHLLEYVFSACKTLKYSEDRRSSIRKMGGRIKGLILNPRLLRDRKKEYKLFKEVWGGGRRFLSDESLITDDMNRFFETYKNKYDIVIVGSDCVWQYEAYPFPNVYFLNEKLSPIKMSYAACASNFRFDRLTSSDKKIVMDSLKAFQYIGVRDIQSEGFMDALSTKLDYEHNCDPAFLLEVDKVPVDRNLVRKKLEDAGVDFSKKIVGIQLRCEALGEKIADCLDLGSDYQYVIIRKRNSISNIFIDTLNPLEWSIVFGFFDVIITDFFHAAIMSVKNNVAPLAFDTDFNHFDRNQTRICDLMTRLNLRDFYYQVQEELQIDCVWLKSGFERIINEVNMPNFRQLVCNESRHYEGFRDKLQRVIKELKQE